MNEIIYKGLVLRSDCCRYYQVREGSVPSIIEDRQRSTLIVTYTPGSTSKSIGNTLGIPVTDDKELSSMGLPKRFTNTTITLNGMVLKKLTSDAYIINIVIVSDSESRIIQDYDKTIMVISDKDYKNQDFINYIFYSGNLAYLKPVGPRIGCYNLRNFPKIIVKDKSLVLESNSETIYSLRRKYDDYVIRSIDYQDQFFLEVRKILDEYGVELVRSNKEETLKTTSYVSYQISQTPIKSNHPKYYDEDDKVIQQKVPIDFTLRTTNMLLYYDFKNKYNNVDFLTNFCSFKVMDKYGKDWSCAIKWGGISEDFNHIYQPDDNSNFSFQCQFRCELYFYEVIDERHEFLQEILLELDTRDGNIQEEKNRNSRSNV